MVNKIINRLINARWNKSNNIKVKTGKFFVNKDSKKYISESAVIELHGNLMLQGNSIGNNGRSSILRMDDNSSLIINKNFEFFYGADIILFENSKLILGNSFINSDCKIRCHKSIEIGDGCAISHDVTIMDSDAHKINGMIKAEPIKIGNYVWIGSRAMILPGVHIEDGAVIAAGAIVTKDVKEKTLVAGCPARVVKENVEWGDH